MFYIIGTQNRHTYDEYDSHTHACVEELFRACTEPEPATTGPQSDDFPIFATCGGGRIVALKVNPKTTCSSVKLELGKRLNRCPASFRVVVCGKELRGGRNISEYNIRSGSTLELSEFLLGGMMQEMIVLIANLSCPQSAAPAVLPNADSAGANSSIPTSPFLLHPGPDFVEAASSPSRQTQLGSQMLGGLADSRMVREEWQELVDFVVSQAHWERARSTLLAMGLRTGNDDPWQIVGLHKETGPSALVLESRRRTLFRPFLKHWHNSIIADGELTKAIKPKLRGWKLI